MACDKEQCYLPAGLDEGLMPRHVAIIMDGNRRWAVERDLPVVLGHCAGRKKLQEIYRLCSKWGIKVLTVFAFSTENWARPEEEVQFLMGLIEEVVRSDLDDMGKDVRFSAIGNRSNLPSSLLEAIIHAEDERKTNTGIQLNLAINYGGRYDILQACKGIAAKVNDGLLLPKDITENIFEQELETKCTKFQCPDLLIRTSGELRLSNFLLWQSAYTEFYFDKKLFPDFGETDFIEALSSFQNRQRRYGGYKY